MFRIWFATHATPIKDENRVGHQTSLYPFIQTDFESGRDHGPKGPRIYRVFTTTRALEDEVQSNHPLQPIHEGLLETVCDFARRITETII